MNEENHLVRVITSCATREFTLEKSHINVVIVGSASVKGLTSWSTSKFTLVRHHMSAIIVGSHSGICPLSHSTREFTLEKSLMSVGNVGSPLSVVSFANMFYHTVGFLLVLLLVSFAVKKLFILM